MVINRRYFLKSGIVGLTTLLETSSNANEYNDGKTSASIGYTVNPINNQNENLSNIGEISVNTKTSEIYYIKRINEERDGVFRFDENEKIGRLLYTGDPINDEKKVSRLCCDKDNGILFYEKGLKYEVIRIHDRNNVELKYIQVDRDAKEKQVIKYIGYNPKEDRFYFNRPGESRLLQINKEKELLENSPFNNYDNFTFDNQGNVIGSLKSNNLDKLELDHGNKKLSLDLPKETIKSSRFNIQYISFKPNNNNIIIACNNNHESFLLSSNLDSLKTSIIAKLSNEKILRGFAIDPNKDLIYLTYSTENNHSGNILRVSEIK